MEKLKVGIIGCGNIANGKHMPSIAEIEELEMVAFCDTRCQGLHRLQRVAER